VFPKSPLMVDGSLAIPTSIGSDYFSFQKLLTALFNFVNMYHKWLGFGRLLWNIIDGWDDLNNFVWPIVTLLPLGRLPGVSARIIIPDRGVVRNGC